jgi:hypothetical protein
MWTMTDNTMSTLMGALRDQFSSLFTKLGIEGSAAAIDEQITPTAVHHPCPTPESLRKKVAVDTTPDDNPNAD